VVQPYHEFKRWVPPPPNPPEMTFQEKQEVGCKHVSNPPLCHCGRPSKLQLPDLDLPDKFTPFFRCKQRTHVSIIALPNKFIVLNILTHRGLIKFVVQDGWSLCDFQEDIYGSKSHWPSEEDVQAFESGEKPWPCDEPYRPCCKCGILAPKGVVPSELGYGWYCGNSYRDYWVKSLS
jgi:hypothetical protein